MSEELERLSRLRDQGLLSNDEFQAAKAKLLAPAPAMSNHVLGRLSNADGRLVLALGSSAMFASLLLPWIDILVVRLTGFDVLRLALGFNRIASDLESLLGEPLDDVSYIRAGAILFLGLYLLTALAPMLRSAQLRLLLTFSGSVGTAIFLTVVGFQVRQGPLELLGIGAWLFFGGLLVLLTTSAMLLVRSNLARPVSSARSLPALIVSSKSGRRILILAVGPIAITGLVAWFASPNSADGPIVVVYELGPVESADWAPKGEAVVTIEALGSDETVRLQPLEVAPSEIEVSQFAAGRWKTGDSLTIYYQPSLFGGRARDLGIETASDADESAVLFVDVPERPTWRSRLGEQELVVRLSISGRQASIAVEHEEFGNLGQRTLRRVNEAQAIAVAAAQRAQDQEREQQVRASCLDLQTQWRQAFVKFNEAELELYSRNWGFERVTRAYTDWARRARNMRNGLVEPYNATASNVVGLSAAQVAGASTEISAINRRALSEIAEQRSKIDIYIYHWEDVYRAAQIESRSLWQSREGAIQELRDDARSGYLLDLGC